MSGSAASEQVSPRDAWNEMQRGNRRFTAGEPAHPRQNVDHRSVLAAVQRPHAALLGCSDSRLAAEIIFDEGLGDLFVIRNAGQVITDSVIGSLEYAVAILQVPLIVVLGHDECGAVRAAIESTKLDSPPLPPQIWRQIATIVPAVRRVIRADGTTPDTVNAETVGREHLRETVSVILNTSEIISDAVAEGRLAIVAANYRLAEGRVVPDTILGDAENLPD